MKKIISLLIIMLCSLTLTGCGNSNTLNVKRKIVLNVNSDVTPEFASNFGEGSYDESTKTYTHNIDYIKDLYIYMSYEGLKTETIYISTLEMEQAVITKEVDFGAALDVEVEITVEGVKTLEGLEISNSLDYSNLIIGKKNIFKLTLPSREKDYEINFTLPNYKEFNIQLNKNDLVSGSVKANALAITNEQMYIGFSGNNYQYEIYSMTTNDLIASGNKWYEDNKIEYVLVDKNDSYYVETYNSYQKSFRKVEAGIDTIIDLGNEESSIIIGYLQINTIDNWYYDSMLYDKTKQTLKKSNNIPGSLETTGLLIKSSENKWFYMDSLLGKILDTGDNLNYEYTLNYEHFTEVNLNVTRINTKTNEVISTGFEDDIYISGDTKAKFENNTFSFVIYEIDEASIYIDLYNKENEKIDTMEYYINKDFRGEVCSGTLNYEGRTVPFQFPIFLEDMEYDSVNNKYTYPSQIIDTSASYVEFEIIDETGYRRRLYSSDNPYIMDEESNVIMYTEIGHAVYFELIEGKRYTLNSNGKKYTFVTTKSHIETGKILIIDENAPKKTFKIPQDYTIEIEGYEDYEFIRNSDGLIEVPVGNNVWLNITVSNGYASVEEDICIKENTSLYEFETFYVLNSGKITSDYSTYYITKTLGSNGIEYVYLEKYSTDTEISDILETNINQVLNNGNVEENYTISRNDFVYNEELKAYYYDFSSQFDHIISSLESYNSISSNWSQDYCYYYDHDINKYLIYVNNGTTIEYKYYYGGYKTISYTITNNDSKYIELSIDKSNNPYQFIVTPINK